MIANFLFLLFASGVLSISTEFSKDQIASMKKVVKTCLDESKGNRALLLQQFKNKDCNPPKDTSCWEFYKVIMIKGMMVDDNELPDPELIADMIKMPGKMDPNAADDLVNKCKTQVGNTNPETLAKVFSCLMCNDESGTIRQAFLYGFED